MCFVKGRTAAQKTIMQSHATKKQEITIDENGREK